MEKTLAEKCFQYRLKHNLTQRQLSEFCGVATGVISKCERELPINRMSAGKIMRIVGKESE